MSTQNPRKRAAPGASPMGLIQHNMQQPYKVENEAGASPLMQWHPVSGAAGDASGFVKASTPGDDVLNLSPSPSPCQQAVSIPSNSLARRQINRAIIPANPRPYSPSPEQWAGFGADGLLVSDNAAEQDNVERLEEKAQNAKREALAKRKQIPPFVQKLSSFLEERKNEDLIRWSEKGDSFIVLDEDEFAKTLIPELFKHNNYASFVRQLNMYGFHKCVGLSDNSMRASERKNKSPSEYSNPYFRRGHPNLLWLINKPKNGSKGKKGGKNLDGDGDSEEEVLHDEMAGPQKIGPSSNGRRPLPASKVDSQPLPKKEMAMIREELHKVREQQKLILGAINRLQRNNNDLYNQALMFQSQHDRHQNSINAILIFLANVFRKTIEDQGSSQNVSDIISSLMSSQGQQPHQGSVVDLGDFIQSQTDPDMTLGGQIPKKARGLLPPIPSHSDSQSSSSRTQSMSSNPYHGPEMGHVTELPDTSPPEPTPPSLHQELRRNPHESMMKIINDHNATRIRGLDLPEATELVTKAPNNLNNDQRSKLVDLMAGKSSSAPSVPDVPAISEASSIMPSSPPVPTPSTSTAPVETAPVATPPPPSLSPILRSPAMLAPSLSHINTNQNDLEQLKRLQSEQDAKINELSDLLGPLSPSGHVPGLGSDENTAYFDPPNMNIDQFLDSDAFLNDMSFADGNDFNFGLDEGLGEGLSAPSPTGTEEIQREEIDHDTKRRRIG